MDGGGSGGAFVVFFLLFQNMLFGPGGLYVYHSKKRLYCICTHKVLRVLHNMIPRGQTI